MIACPNCRTALTEETPVCPGCNLELRTAKRVLGPAPRLNHLGVTDFSGCLSKAEEKRLLKEVNLFQQRFPQSRLAVVIRAFSEDFPLGAQLFWLFNTAGLASEDSKLGKNRDILIGIDSQQNLAGITIGYGLEPFLGQEALDHLMQLAAPQLQLDDYAAGALAIIRGLSKLMEGVCRELREMLGLDYDFAVKEKQGEY